MSFDPAALIAGLFVSSIGFVLFSYGKKMTRVPQMTVGLVLLVYPYFVSTIWLMFVIAAVLLGLLWVVVRQGY